MAFLFASSRFPNRSRPRPLVSGLVIEKAVIDRTNRIDTARVQEVEDENEDDDEDDWGSGGRELVRSRL
jgi:hypothetical protein